MRDRGVNPDGTGGGEEHGGVVNLKHGDNFHILRRVHFKSINNFKNEAFFEFSMTVCVERHNFKL